MPKVTSASFIIVLLVCPTLHAALAAQGQPTYHGKSLKQWLELARNDDPKVRVRALVHLGLGPFDKTAVPTLIAALKDKEREVRRAAIRALADIGRNAVDAIPDLQDFCKEASTDEIDDVCRALARMGPAAVPALIEFLGPSSPQSIRDAARQALEEIGPGAKDAVPALIKEMKNPSNCYPGHAASALSHICEAAVPSEILELLRDPEWTIDAIKALPLKGPGAREASSSLASLLPSEDFETTEYVIRLLGYIGPDAAPAVPKLVGVLGDKKIGCQAAFTLRRIGKPAEAALTEALSHTKPLVRANALEALAVNRDEKWRSAVFRALKDESAEVRRSAARCLPGRIDPKSEWPLVVVTLNDADAEVRQATLSSLSWMEPPPKGALSVIIAALSDTNKGVREEAADSLARLGPAATCAVSELARAAEDESFLVRKSALRAIGRTAAASPESVQALTKALYDPKEDIRQAGMNGLIRLCSEANIATDDLVHALHDEDERVAVDAALLLWKRNRDEAALASLVRWAQVKGPKMTDGRGTSVCAIWALGEIGPNAKNAVPTLLCLLDCGPSSLKGEVAKTLGQIGPDAGEAAPALGQILLQGREYSHEAGHALAQLGKPGLPYLLKALQVEKGYYTRKIACMALRDLGPDAQPATPHLIELLYDTNSLVRMAAAETLQAIGSGARSATPALVESVKDKDADVRTQVVKALARMGQDPLVVSALTSALTDEASDIRTEAAKALASFGPVAKEAVPALRAAFKDVQGRVRIAAGRALWRITGDKETVLRDLRASAKSEEGRTRVAAAAALWEIERSELALLTVIAALHDDDPDVRWEAQDALIVVGIGLIAW
jgi:HEAT repeat protein